MDTQRYVLIRKSFTSMAPAVMWHGDFLCCIRAKVPIVGAEERSP